MFLLVVLYAAGMIALFNQLRALCVGAACHVLALTPQEASLLREFRLTLESYARYIVASDILSVLLMFALALLVFWRKSDRWIGNLLSITLLLMAVVIGPGIFAFQVRYPALDPTLELLEFIAALLIFLSLFIFPDGRFVPRWTRYVPILMIGFEFLLWALESFSAFSSVLGNANQILFPAVLILTALAQIYRYRHYSTPAQRQQTKWIMYGLIVIVIDVMTWTILTEIFPLRPGPGRLVFNLSIFVMSLGYMVFPLSIAISILRYRLWDIDIIINRTLVYGLLTAILAAIYFATVILLQGLLRNLVGQESPLAIVISTLLIAALFAPLRRRLQDLIDRRFYRRKYVAEKMLAQFAASARDEVDLGELAKELIRVIEETMEPEHVSIWLKEH